jgi:hypothetical protein
VSKSKKLLKLSRRIILFPVKKLKHLTCLKINFIEELKDKLKCINFDKFCEYKPTSTESIIQVKDLDAFKDIDKIKEIISMVEANESKAYQLPLIEGYYRGNLYRSIQLKFGKKEEFLNYFEDFLNISRQTIYFYLYFADLIDNYPALLATGFTMTILVKERKKSKNRLL